MSALKGLQVLDLTRARSGPTAVRQLGDWGANVIRIELPTSIEAEDLLGGFPSDFQNIQRNKRSLTLNLKVKEGRDIFLNLVKRADVVVENFRPDVKARLGIDYETLAKINPRLIYASISGFGQSGPYALRPGFDQIAQGVSGIMSVTGETGGGPLRAGIAVGDSTAGLYCAFGIMAALYERQTSGRGQWVTTSLMESLIAMLDFQAARWLIDKEVPARVGNDHPKVAPMGAYESKDGYFNLGAGSDVIWVRLCQLLGIDHLVNDPRFKTAASRVDNRAELTTQLNAIFRTRTTTEWVEALNEAGIPAGPIYSIDQMFADPQVRHVGMTAKVTHPTLGPLDVVNQPVQLSRTASAVTRAAPLKGQHTHEILREFGYDDAQIQNFASAGII